MKAQKKTNAARILDNLKIPYEIKTYPVDENDLSAQHVAQSTGQPLEQTFKTLVAKGDKTGVLVACIPGGRELDLKAIANFSGNKKVDLVPMKDVLGLTGYIRGGCSPLGMKKTYPTYLDESALQYTTIMVSAGQRGCQLVLDPKDLVKAVQAAVCPISHEEA
jgi:Cys-tRNA(Pro)/Cys-tRNA(Cys) deacylase